MMTFPGTTMDALHDSTGRYCHQLLSFSRDSYKVHVAGPHRTVDEIGDHI